MKNTLPLIAALLFTISVSAQQIDTADLDRLFDSLTVHNKSMASVLLTRNGVKIYERAIGYAVTDSTRQIRATPATRYRIGSITKTFTATMIMQLVEERKLTLDTRLAKYFPAIPNAGEITIEMMLRHRSGIHNFTDDDAYWESMTKPVTPAGMLNNFATHKPDFKPGEQAIYSNTNYVLLGYIIEDITRKTYGANLQERILSRAGLKNTRYGGGIDPDKGDAYSYIFSKRWEKQEDTDLSQPAGAGAIVSTPADVTTFLSALFDGKLVSKESLRQMTNFVDGHGIGLAPMPFYGKKGYGHTGGLDGFQTVAAYYPADSLAAAVFSNGVEYALNDILIALLSAYYKMPVIIPTFDTVALRPEELDQYVGVYSSKQLPLKMTIWRHGDRLLAKATGQSSFRLTPVKKDVFRFDAARVTMEFRPEENAFTLTQDGESFQFNK
ncbi:serine hydrolase domain-containing protein [Dyadobacter sp. 676]|uniref:Serine hydrolase domain-containing protein n=1 Tax=Dyadobacter sp. 676 TaxID=3088362 RepID=A0AAU8FJB3_9BACT